MSWRQHGRKKPPSLGLRKEGGRSEAGRDALGTGGLSPEASILQLRENGDLTGFLCFCFVFYKEKFKNIDFSCKIPSMLVF